MNVKTNIMKKKKLIITGSVVVGLLLILLISTLLPLKPTYSIEIRDTYEEKVYVSKEANKLEVTLDAKESIAHKFLYLRGSKSVELKLNDEVVYDGELKADSIKISLDIDSGVYDAKISFFKKNSSEVLITQELQLFMDNTKPKLLSIINTKNEVKQYTGKEIDRTYYTNKKELDYTFRLSEKAELKLSCIVNIEECEGKEYDNKKNVQYSKTINEKLKYEYIITDLAGNMNTGKIKFIFDNKKPKLEVLSSTNITTGATKTYSLRVKVNEPVEISLGSKKGSQYEKWGYEIKNIELKIGENKFKIIAVDYAVNKTEKNVKISVSLPVVTNAGASNCDAAASRMCVSYSGSQYTQCVSTWYAYCDAKEL